MRFVVAIDGPAASGKGTVARQLAARFGFAHLDTGLIYRALARRLLDEALAHDPENVDIRQAERMARMLCPADLAKPGLRDQAVTQMASRVAALGPVRQALLAFQRDFAARDGGAVLDGRDIGSVICPDANVKLFITAALAERARRRYIELQKTQACPGLDLATVEADLKARDTRDAGRVNAPMYQTQDAHLLDTTELSIDTVVARASRIIEQALEQVCQEQG